MAKSEDRQQSWDAEAQRIFERVHAEASAQTGLNDFGPDIYEEPLRLLIDEIRESGMNEASREFWIEELVIALIGRLAREEGGKRHPEYKSQTISRPLIICGLPRTGTTALHKLLSVDPQFQGLEHWLTAWPKPRPPRDTWGEEPGYRQAAKVLERRFADSPELRLSHDVLVEEVDECIEVLRQDLVSNRFPSMLHSPRYDAWMRAQDETPYYHRLADTLRLIGLHDDRTWLLKNPGHFAQIEALIAALPDARVVITHRDPQKSLPSLCSLLAMSRKLTCPEVDLAEIGPRELSYWTEAKRRTDTYRAAHPEVKMFDLHHRDFVARPIEVVRSLYAFFDLVLSADVERAMQDWLATHPANTHLMPAPQLETYGLTPEEVTRALGDG